METTDVINEMENVYGYLDSIEGLMEQVFFNKLSGNIGVKILRNFRNVYF